MIQEQRNQNQFCFSKKTFLGLFFLATLIILFFTFKPLHAVTFSFFIIIGYYLITDFKTGIILTLISFPIGRNSIASITGVHLPIIFYVTFILVFFLILYSNFLGSKIWLPQFKLNLIVILFTLYLLLSIRFISNEPGYGTEKFIYFLTSVSAIYVPVLISYKYEDFEKYIKAVNIFSIFLLAFSVLKQLGIEGFTMQHFGGRFTTLGINPIWIGRYFSYAILSQIFFIGMYFKNGLKDVGKIIFLICLIVIQMYFMLLTGSRGPFFALITGVLVTILINFKIRVSQILLAGIVFLLLFSFLLLILPDTLTERILSQDHGGQMSSLLRVKANLDALEMFWNNKITGSGFGGFNVFYLKYPHNIVTEILAELGLIGIGLFMLITYLTLRYLIILKKNSSKILYFFMSSLFLTSFINANLSGHIGYNFYFFFSIGLIYSYYLTTKRQKS